MQLREAQLINDSTESYLLSLPRETSLKETVSGLILKSHSHAHRIYLGPLEELSP